MADEWKYKDLPRAANGIAPAEWDEDKKEFVVYTGVNDVKAVGVEDRLTAIEDKLDSVIENGSVNTQLTGSNVEYKNEKITPINKEKIRVSTAIDAVVNLSRFKDVQVFVLSTLDKPLNLEVRPFRATVHTYNGETWGDVSIPITSRYFNSHVNTFLPIIKDYCFDEVMFRFKANEVPTTGELTLTIIGTPN